MTIHALTSCLRAMVGMMPTSLPAIFVHALLSLRLFSWNLFAIRLYTPVSLLRNVSRKMGESCQSIMIVVVLLRGVVEKKS